MNAKSFLELHGAARAKQVAEVAGTNLRYFRAIAKGDRRPSVELAKRLVKASGHELDLISLLESVDWDQRRKSSAC